MAPVAIDFPVAVPANPRIGNGNEVTNATIHQTAMIANRAFEGFNIYRDGELFVSLWQENTYTDTDVVASEAYCYQVSAMYSVCGESAKSDQACAGYVGLPEGTSNEVSVYPNPANDRVNIECRDMKDITVFNYVGQVVFRSDLGQANSTQLNTSKYESGVYVVRINTENGVVTKRVIINR